MPDDAHPAPSRVGAHKHRCPGHAELLLAVDAELGPVDAEAADIALDALAWRLMPGDPNPRFDLTRMAGLVSGARPTARTGTGMWTRRLADSRPEIAAAGTTPLRSSPTGTLRLSEALMGLPSHPLVVAVALVEAARRAGIHAGLVGADALLLVAHHHLREPLVVDPSDPARGAVDAQECAHGAELRWQCAHQSTGVILDLVADDAQRRGDLTRAIRAAELRLDLPFDDEALERRRAEVARVRAKLN